RRLGSTVARLKLKGIDGGPHKRWSMWFNSMQREEPYLALTCPESCRDAGVPSGIGTQVLHGCRQVLMALTARATHVLQWSVQRVAIPRGGANPRKPIPVRIEVCNSTS